MILIETDDADICREMLSGFQERKTINISGKDFILTDITRNYCTFRGASVEAKGDFVMREKWGGVGFPPVGTVCDIELENGLAKWGRVKILFIGSDHAIFVGEHGEQHFLLKDIKFRPIRTKEQIAADLADKEIKKIAEIICRDGVFDIYDPELMESAVALYDSGLRFQN